MKLAVVEYAARKSYVSREAFYLAHALADEHGWHIAPPSALGWRPGRLRERFLRRWGRLPEVVLFFETFELAHRHRRELERLGCRRLMRADDLHWYRRGMRRRNVNGFAACEAVLATYGDVFESFYPRLAAALPVHWVPHAASPLFIQELNPRPGNRIFLSGALNTAYPLRCRMAELAERPELRIEHHPHPGYRRCYDYGVDDRVGWAFGERIRACRAAFTDASVYGYVLAKHFEIPATGSLLIAERRIAPALARLGFEAGRHWLPVTEEDLEERLQWLLEPAHHVEVDEIRARGQALVCERHTTAHRARQVDAIAAGGRARVEALFSVK